MLRGHRRAARAEPVFARWPYATGVDQDQLADEIRAPAQVAYRALALFSVVGLALGADRSDIMEWLTENDLWSELAPSEAGFIDTPVPSRQQKIDAKWLSERLIVII